MAVPMIVKMPEPMTAPIPSEVRLSQPGDFFNRTSAFSESHMTWSIPLQRKSCEATDLLRSRPGKPAESHHPMLFWSKKRPSIYPETVRRATCCRLVFVTRLSFLGLLKLRIALDEFLCAASGETYRDAAVFVIALDTYACSHHVTVRAHPSAGPGVCHTPAVRR